MSIQYITIEQAIETHKKTIQYSGGGLEGQLNIGQLESVLEHIKNDDYYPTFPDNPEIATNLCRRILTSIFFKL